MTEEAPSESYSSEELKRQIDALAADLVEAIDGLTRQLQRSLLKLADRVDARMQELRFGPLAGPVVYDIQEGVKAEAKRFSQEARAKIQEVTRKKAQLAGLGDELSALATMTEEERAAMRKRLQEEIASSEKTKQELEEELAEARVKITDLEKTSRSRATRDGRRIDKLTESNKNLETLLKKVEAELLQLKDQAGSVVDERDAALKRLSQMEGQIQSVQTKAKAEKDQYDKDLSELQNKMKTLEEKSSKLEASLAKAEQDVRASTQEVEQLRKTAQQIEKVQVTAAADAEAKAELEGKLAEAEKSNKELTKSVADLEKQVQELSELKTMHLAKIAELEQQLAEIETKTKTLTKSVPELEKQVEELTGLKDSHTEKISKLEEELASKTQELKELKADALAPLETKLKDLDKEREQLTRDKEDLEQKLEKSQAKIEEMEEEYARFTEVKHRLEKLEARGNIQDILLKKDQHYIVFTTLAQKLVEGKYTLTAKELGYSISSGVSLAAWLDKFFLDLQEEGLVAIHRSAGGGLPTAKIEVTEQGKAIFSEATERAAL